MKHTTQLTGTIKTFIQDKGFGFIAREGFDDLFVHITAFRGAGPREFHPGDKVSFEIGNGPDGRPRAINVRVQLAASTHNSKPTTRN